MLGKQAEYCFETYLKQSSRYEILVSNIQIQGTVETLGELDYLVLDTITEKALHIELACKFYLMDDTIKGSLVEQWIGPNRKDTLYEKLIKLRDKQFPLLYALETIAALDKLPLNISLIEQQLCLKSFLFVPKTFRIKDLPQNYQKCIVGIWMTYAEFTAESDTASYSVPTKKEWLESPENFKEWYSLSEVKKLIQQELLEKKSPLVYKNITGKIEKIFVVWWK